MSDLRPIRIALSELRHIHDAIIDNPDFNLTVAAKRNLRELCAWVETYGARDDEIERLTAEVDAYKANDEIRAIEVKRLTGERDRQYDRNVEQIAQIAKLQARVDELEAALDAESRNRVRIAQWLLEQEKEIERLEASIKLIHWMVGQEGIDNNIIAEDVCAICDQALDSKEQT